MSMLKNCFGLSAVPDLSFLLLSLVNADEVEELVARLGLALETAENAAGNGAGGGLFDAAHHHAQVARLHDHGDTLGLEDFHDSVGDFLGQTLLDLKTAGKHLGDSGELGKADDGLVGDVTDVHLRGSTSARKDCGIGGILLTLPVNGTRWCSQRDCPLLA
jgi:hypothetical protein